nr:hypothetical protein CFP56_60387 [Quercus suber]
MSSGREVTSEKSSSVREGAGYDEAYPSGREPEEDLSWSSAREPFAHSPVKREEGRDKEEGDVEGEEDDGEGNESDRGSEQNDERLVSWVDSSGTRPFILLSIWTVNDLYPTMTRKVFNTLRDSHQIPDNIPLCLPGKFKKCYLGKMTDVGMYDAMFTARLRLSLTALHCQLANFLSLFVCQITPNAWRIFIGAEEQASGSAPNVGPKTTFKRKPNTKDDCLSKKGIGPLIGVQQQKALSPSLPRHGSRKGLMTRKASVDPYPVQRLITHKDYAVEVVTSIIKEMDLHSREGILQRTWGLLASMTCQGPSKIGAWPVRLVIRRFRKCQEIENKERAQYSESVCTFNQDLTVKTKALVEDTRCLEEVEKVKTNLAMKLAFYRE